MNSKSSARTNNTTSAPTAATAGSATAGNATAASTMEEEVYYCHELARRSVARAALHLGLKDGMSQDSLDVMADVLLKYLERVGKATSYLVESAGRPSSHANALDALQAINLTTTSSAAVLQVNVKESAEDGDEQTTTATTAAANRSGNTAPWKDLAVFCFGPKWQEERSTKSRRNSVGGSVGGKVGPSGATSQQQQQPESSGWVAPYLSEVPVFPMTTKYNLPHGSAASMLHITNDDGVDDLASSAATTAGDQGTTHDAAIVDQKKLSEIPVTVFLEWGTVGSDASTRDLPPKKKQKTGEVEVKIEEHDMKVVETRAPYVPSFMPVFPQSLQSGRSMVVDIPDVSMTLALQQQQQQRSYNENAIASISGVRSSLVDFGQASQYWGSGWDGDEHTVAPGKATADSSSSNNTALVVPLSRPSAARVSKILEGSMDAAATGP
jgi:hypothetical protein